MPAAIDWTPEQDAAILRLRGEGATWDSIADALNICRWTVGERGRRIGAQLPAPETIVEADPERDPLPAGHPETWGVLVRGTCLAGMAWPGFAT